MRRCRRVDAGRLRQVRHEALAPRPVLAAQALVVGPVAVERRAGAARRRARGRRGRAADQMSRSPPPGQRRAGVERLVEAADRAHRVRAQDHVAAGAEDARTERDRAGCRGPRGPAKRSLRQPRPKPPRRSNVTCASVRQLEGSTRPVTERRVRVLGDGLLEPGEPAAVDRSRRRRGTRSTCPCASASARLRAKSRPGRGSRA